MSTDRILPSWPLTTTMVVLITFTLLLSCTRKLDASSAQEEEKVYVVYMGNLPKGEYSATADHMNLLTTTLGSKRAKESLLHSYKRTFNGFVAKLTVQERKRIARLKGVVSVFPSLKKQLHTTRSWDFMGFPVKAERSDTESDIIVGVLDTGIWPESSSFNDKGFGSPPSKWKGTCQSSSSNFTCNNKIIGARYYHSQGSISPPDVASPRDTEGHGTHTASTAAGDLVVGASLYGLGYGTARGGVPSARLAVYKICWSDGCSDADILAAFDDAIADGVDIISLSVGGSFALEYFDDPIAIGAFHAMKHGVLTSNSAGNSGPSPGSITNVSPWSLSVAANTIDRKFVTTVELGNNITYEGVSVNTFVLQEDSYSLVYGGDVPAQGTDGSTSRYCLPDSLDPKLVNNTIVLCDQLSDGEAAAVAGAAGTIMQDQGDRLRDLAFAFPLPASYLGSSNGAKVYNYINQTRDNASATIYKSVAANETSAPFVVSFSSRGPNTVTRDILKPDISAPGVDIVAAWSEATTVTGYPEDPRVAPYNIISGTSMSCPHASAAAAYVKSFHPTWSPAAIKSALMTTAAPMSAQKNTDGEFAYGSGHLDPLKAKTPGLVYDIEETDYVNFLCGQGYSNANLRLVTGDNVTCSSATNSTAYDLNYPSFAASTAPGQSIKAVFHRTVTNVGSPVSTYKAMLGVVPGLSVTVQPGILSFKALGERQNFTVTVSADVANARLSGSLAWYDGVHLVRSPIVAFAS